MTDAVASARAYFPRGLTQPEATFRFSADALLLAAFVLRRCLPERDGTLLDLGCGCGVVGLACLLAAPGLSAAGIDAQPELVAAARENAARLGLANRYAARVRDLASGGQDTGGRAYSAVAANMPFRSLGSGRLPRSTARRKALFAEEGTLPAFLGAAKHGLAENGNCAFIYPWDARETLLRALEAHGLPSVTVLPVWTGKDDGARCLVRAVHAEAFAGQGVCLEDPLRLHMPDGAYTEEALAFCPWLAARPWVNEP